MDSHAETSLEIAEDVERPIPPTKRNREPAKSRFESTLCAHSGHIVAGLCILAALRILVFAAAFPLSNIIDERYHLMTIRMYAQGHLPGRELPRIDDEFAKTFLLYWSPEYSESQGTMNREGVIGPLSRLSPEERASALREDFYTQKLEQWSRRANFEAQSAPFYYVVTAGWFRLGAVMGMRNWVLDYWPRFINPLVYALLVWLSYRFIKTVEPDTTFLHLAVPALIAVFPQDVFFGMNRDVFSAPLAAAALLLMLRATADSTGRYWALVGASFLVGLAFLSSVSNFVLYPSLAVTILLWTLWSKESIARKAWVIAASAAAAGILPGLWMLRNYVVMGDLTGGREKTLNLRWTVKPLADMFHHPLFSAQGLLYFLLELTRRFWRGEYVWHGQPMKTATADRFYVLSSVILVVTFAVYFLAYRKTFSPLQKLAGIHAAFLLSSSVLFLAVLSLLFDFHDCAYPSRQLPYFVSGRIITGVMLPFVYMYAIGLERLTSPFRKWVSPVAVLACLLIFVTVAEIGIRSVVFLSPYNFYALSGWFH